MITQPPSHPLVSASILSADFGYMADECRDVLDKGADMLHLDVMDAHFVPNLTMGADMIRALRRHFPKAYLDVHLMVEQPDLFIEQFAAAGANHFSFHIEVCEPLRPVARGGYHAKELIDAIHRHGMHAGLVVNPPTPVEPLGPFLADIEMALVMSVNPGRSGQAFIPAALDKARWLRAFQGRGHGRPGPRIEMDGGINPETAPRAAAAGVDVFVTASALFGAPDRAAVIRALHAADQVPPPAGR